MIDLAAMAYETLYHAQEIASIKLSSGCPCNGKLAGKQDLGKYVLIVFIETVIPLALVGYEMIIANSALRTTLAVYHLVSNARS